MTNNEAAKWIQLYIDLAKIDPSTGEEAYLNEDAKKTLEAMEIARDALTCANDKKMHDTNDLISRAEAIDAIDKIFPADPMRNDYTQGITCGAALAEEYIKQLPTAQPERTGRWIHEIDSGAGMLKCSVCECRVIEREYKIAIGTAGLRFCPYCGARMEGEVNG